MTRPRAIAAAALALCVVAAAACDDDDSDPAQVDMEGIWTFTASPSSPPRAVTCTGNLAGETGNLCASFQIDVRQDEESISGSGTERACDAD